MMLSEGEVQRIAQATVQGVRPTLRRVIGDRTPQQYDAADQVVEAVASAVTRALTKVVGVAGSEEVKGDV